MKKLMILAAVAAVSVGAFASLCDDDPAKAAGCLVYNVKFALKAPATKCLTAKCAGTSTAVGYLELASRKYVGLLWACTNTCDALNEGIKFTLWDSKAQKEVVPFSAASTNATTTFKIADRFSKKATKVEAFWDVQGDTDDVDESIKALYAAGFGTFNTKTGIATSISGYAVGMIVPESADTKCSSCDPQVCTFCDDFEAWGDSTGNTYSLNNEGAVAAYGTWSIKYNASLAKGSKTVATIVKSYEK